MQTATCNAHLTFLCSEGTQVTKPQFLDCLEIFVKMPRRANKWSAVSSYIPTISPIWKLILIKLPKTVYTVYLKKKKLAAQHISDSLHWVLSVLSAGPELNAYNISRLLHEYSDEFF